MSDAFALLCGLILEDGRAWGGAAHGFQRADALAVIGSAPRRNFLNRPRGASKTSDAAAIALALMVTEAPDDSRSYVYAVDRDQAGDLLDALRGFVNRTPGLSSLVELTNHTLTVKKSGASLLIEPSDAAGAWSKRPWLIVIDELSSWPSTSNHRTLWGAIVSALPKRQDSRLVVLTMAGHLSHFSHRVYVTAGKSEGWRLSHVPGPCPWWSPADVEQAREDLEIVTEGEYARLILCEWSELSDEDLATEADITAAVRSSPAVLPPADGVKYLAALDLGTRRDYSALAVGHAEGDRLVVDLVKHWRPRKGRNVVLGDVEAFTLETCRRYGARLLFDRHQAEQMSQNLASAGVRAREFVFSSSNATRLAKSLVTMLRDHRIELPCDDELVSELRTARLRETGSGAKIVNPSGTHDDLVVTVGMLCAELGGAVRAPMQLVVPTGFVPVTAMSPLTPGGRMSPKELRELVERAGPRPAESRRSASGRVTAPWGRGPGGVWVFPAGRG